MKRLPILIITVFLLLTATVYGGYNVETEDDEYVSDEVFFAPVSTWDEVLAQKINLKKGKMIFYANRDNEPQKIETTVMPVNTTNKTVSFQSEDETVATVSEEGVVMPMGKIGNTVIDITCGKAKSKMKVSVVKAVDGVTMSQSELTLYTDRPVTAQLEAIISPEDATIKDVKWSSGDNSIAYVDSEGLVYPNGVGTTDVYAETVDGGYKAKCTVTVSTWEKREENIPVSYSEYNISLEDMVRAQMSAGPTIFTTNAYPALEEEVRSFSDPKNLVSGYYKYQFFDLSPSNGIDADVLDTYLRGKGILDGMGSEFKNAADDNNISEIYLVIHACLESGSGTSQLARGVEYNGATVYNLFGIGAVDADPLGGGAKYAYEQGWTSVEKAIEGGAKWISENYINNSRYRQNTLYKMRWNPEAPGNHQYATDVEWASKQAKEMSAMFEAFPSAKYHFDIPLFKGEDKPVIK